MQFCQDSLMNRKFKRTVFEKELFCNIMNLFSVTLDQLDQKVLISFFKQSNWHQTFEND